MHVFKFSFITFYRHTNILLIIEWVQSAGHEPWLGRTRVVVFFSHHTQASFSSHLTADEKRKIIFSCLKNYIK